MNFENPYFHKIRYDFRDKVIPIRFALASKHSWRCGQSDKFRKKKDAKECHSLHFLAHNRPNVGGTNKVREKDQSLTLTPIRKGKLIHQPQNYFNAKSN